MSKEREQDLEQRGYQFSGVRSDDKGEVAGIAQAYRAKRRYAAQVVTSTERIEGATITSYKLFLKKLKK